MLLGMALICAAPAHAADAKPSLVTKTVSGDEFVLGDGRDVKLEGIRAPFPETGNFPEKSRQALQLLVENHLIVFENVATDRYARSAAQAYVLKDNGKKDWLQGEMLSNGMVFIYPPVGTEPHLDEMFKLESVARHLKRGIWADAAYADTAADQAGMKYGHFAFVSGVVREAERVKDKVYLNFGADWHKDFTVAIAAHDLKNFRDKDIDPLDYKGKTIRVRGWIKREFGPMITATHPAQIEILDRR